MRTKSCLPELSFQKYCDQYFNETNYKNQPITQSERRQKYEIRLDNNYFGICQKHQKQELKEYINYAIRQTSYVRKQATEKVKQTFGNPNQWLKVQKKYFSSENQKHKTFIENYDIEIPKEINFKNWKLTNKMREQKIRSFSVKQNHSDLSKY